MPPSSTPQHHLTDSDIARIGRGVETCTLPKPEWTHAAHFAAAVWLLTRPGLDAERAMPPLIRAYNEATGVQNTDTAGYHETITLASLRAAARPWPAAPTPASPASWPISWTAPTAAPTGSWPTGPRTSCSRSTPAAAGWSRTCSRWASKSDARHPRPCAGDPDTQASQMNPGRRRVWMAGTGPAMTIMGMFTPKVLVEWRRAR